MDTNRTLSLARRIYERLAIAPSSPFLTLRKRPRRATCRARCFSSDSTMTGSGVVVDKYSYVASIPPKEILLNNPEQAEATALVDDLLLYTRQLMGSQNSSGASNLKHVVAYSGGVDSSLVLALLEQAKFEDETVYGVLGKSPAVPQDQIHLARKVASVIGAPLVEVSTTEGDDQTYIRNDGQACLVCKTHLYTALEAVANHAKAEDEMALNDKTNFRLYNGTNADDVQDTTRVGLIAADNFCVQSPLRYTTKDNVRRAARHLNLPNWNIAASPCLRSRLALGVAATQEHLQRIEKAESFVRQKLRDILSETSNLRVRLLAGNCARLEIDSVLLPEVEKRRGKWEHYFVQTLGFQSVTSKAFRSGSVANKSKDTDNRNDDVGDDSSVSASLARLREVAA